jgi:hypothetical protein
MTKKQDYPYIRAWGRMMGSMPYYIEDRVAEARKDRAPQDATYKKDGTWLTVDGITNEETRSQLGLPPLMTPEEQAERARRVMLLSEMRDTLLAMPDEAFAEIVEMVRETAADKDRSRT